MTDDEMRKALQEPLFDSVGRDLLFLYEQRERTREDLPSTWCYFHRAQPASLPMGSLKPCEVSVKTISSVFLNHHPLLHLLGPQ